MATTEKSKCLRMQIIMYVPYSAKFWQGKTSVNRSFQSFGEENVGKFTIANFSYFNESGIWLGKILVNDIHFAKGFPHQNFAQYGMYCMYVKLLPQKFHGTVHTYVHMCCIYVHTYVCM